MVDVVNAYKGKRTAIHPITTGFDALSDELLGALRSCEEGKASYVKVDADKITELKPLLEDEETEFVAVNYKFVAKILSRYDIRLSKNLFTVW